MLEISTIDNHIVLSESVMHELQKLKEFQITMQEMKNAEQEIKDALQAAMIASGLKTVSFTLEDGSMVKFTAVDETIRKTVDSKRLKEELPDIYDAYSKASKVKATLKVSYD